jgi:alanine dehydrogenase
MQKECDIVVLATWSRRPLLTARDAHPGHHLTSLGADEPGKRELSPDLLSSATLIVDDRELTNTTGATASAMLPPGTIDATLSDVLAGHHPGRSDEQQVTVYSPVGLPWQDLALAWGSTSAPASSDPGTSSTSSPDK